VEFAYEAFQFQYKLWEKHDITVEPVIMCIYLCGRSFALFLSLYFKQSEAKRAHTELKCKTGMKQPIYYLHFIIYRQLFLVPFCSNMSWAHPYIESVFVLVVNETVSYVILPQGTQEENSLTKHAVIDTFQCLQHWQSEWDFAVNMFEVSVLWTV
jgi:hypothetical protein